MTGRRFEIVAQNAIDLDQDAGHGFGIVTHHPLGTA
jgi:hypothetical protein